MSSLAAGPPARDVTAPRRSRAVELTDRDAAVRFLVRDLDPMHLEVMETDLGRCLVTTPVVEDFFGGTRQRRPAGMTN